jgi:PAS domain S-box-containing protein
MIRSPVSPDGVDPLAQMRTLITRYLFAAVAGAAIGVALLLAFVPPFLAPHDRLLLVGGHALLALVSLVSMRAPARRVLAATSIVMVGICACVALVSAVLPWGVDSPVLGLLGLVTCMVFVIAGARTGGLVALLSAAIVGALAVGMPGGGSSGMPALQALPDFALRVFYPLLLIGAGAAAGWLVRLVVDRYVRAVAERETRFRSLLGIAADAYWETDRELRLVHYSKETAPGVFVEQRLVAHERPWECGKWRFEPEVEVALRGAMYAREPFRDVPAIALLEGGGEMHVLMSGEPQRDAYRQFTGFWGVLWDTSDAALAQRALQATETRWRDLFTHLPSPIVLHRQGRVVEANPAALVLLGFADPASIAGFRFIDLFEADDAARSEQRMAQLDKMPVGRPLPHTEFRMRSRNGEPRVVRGTGVRVDTEGGPAMLSFFVDETERKMSEERLRNSESLLSHLVDTSPDLMMLGDVRTGRFAMVNQSFVRVTGWSREEAVGRSADDLGLWADTPERARLQAALHSATTVQDMPLTLTTRAGSRIAMRLSAARFTLRANDYMVINARDVSITERERLEREAIVDSASIGIAFTRDHRFVLVNRGFEEMHGWPAGSLTHRGAQLVWPSAEVYRAMDSEVAPALSGGQRVEIERTAMRRDGSTFLARLLGKAVDPSHPVAGGTIWIVEDITDRRQVEQALATARDEAEAASRAKSAFLANTSHEIRTPLNALLGLAKLARAPGVDEERRAKYVDQICDSAETLSEILTDILDLSKIEAGRMTLDRVPFNLREMLTSLQQAYASLADAKGLVLTLEADENLSEVVTGDPVRVRQILSNYLHNAVKFTIAGQVRWRVLVLQDELVRFEVNDSGPGIDESLLHRLFRPFSQADDSVTRRFGGTGLGLSICRELAELMGGEVGVNSQQGQGSSFWAVLPLPPADDDHETTSGGLGIEALAGAHILLVEDNAVNMMIGVAMLEQWGVAVEQATDGRQAIDAVERAVANGLPFDLVLMDVHMPVMSGNQATALLRKRYRKDQLPIVALTAAALVSEREQALAAGMNEFVTKPIDPGRLRATLTRVINASQAA